VSGMSWDEFVESRILRPLGMNHSAACYERLKDKTNVASPHAFSDGKLVVVPRDNFKLGHSAGGMVASAADLCKWVQLLLNHGKYVDEKGDSVQLISKEALDEMWASQIALPVKSPGAYNTHFSGYGFGFAVSDVKGYKQAGHTGGLAGMVTQITLIPELNLGIIVLTNQQAGPAFTSITNQIKDGYLGITGTDRVKENLEQYRKKMDNGHHIADSVWKDAAKIKANGKLPIKTEDYTGSYTDPWFGEMNLTMKDGLFWIAAKRSYRLHGELYYYKGNTFLVKWTDNSMDADAYVNFTLDESGKAKGFTMKPISPLTDFSFDFQDLSFLRKK